MYNKTWEELIAEYEEIEQVCLTSWEKDNLIKSNRELFIRS